MICKMVYGKMGNEEIEIMCTYTTTAAMFVFRLGTHPKQCGMRV